MKGSDHPGPLANIRTVNGVISTGCGPTHQDYEPIDELVDEENAADNSSRSIPNMRSNSSNNNR